MILMVSQRVGDYAQWKSVFDEHRTVREQHGATGHLIYRSGDAPSEVTVLMEVSSEERAKAFLADPSLKAAMERAGVEGAPTTSFLEGELVHYTCPEE